MKKAKLPVAPFMPNVTYIIRGSRQFCQRMRIQNIIFLFLNQKIYCVSMRRFLRIPKMNVKTDG